MNTSEIQYALSKQLPSIQAITTNYGLLELDEELKQVVEDALRTALQARLDDIQGEHS